MRDRPRHRPQDRTFSPGESSLGWCRSCNVPLISDSCSICGSPGGQIILSPPGDVRLSSSAADALLKNLFIKNYGTAEILDGRIVLLNKIAGIDRRDQVILDGHHIATLSFDITTGEYRLDLELAGAVLLKGTATKNVVVCNELLLKGHVKGKWADDSQILSRPEKLVEGANVILEIGRFTGVGVVRQRGDGTQAIRVKAVGRDEVRLGVRRPGIDDVLKANESHLRRLEKMALREMRDYFSRTRLPVNVSFSGGKDSLATSSSQRSSGHRPMCSS